MSKLLIRDYKLGILFLLDHADGRLSNAQICEVLLDETFPNYFLLQQALSELLESELINREGKGSVSYYGITAEGRDNFQYLEKDLPDTVRRIILDRIREQDLGSANRYTCMADYEQSALGGYRVHLRAAERKETMFNLEMSVPGREAAEAICENWPLRAEKIYDLVMDHLM